MNQTNFSQSRRIGRLHTEQGDDQLLLISVTAEERLSESYTVRIRASSEQPVAMQDLLGTRMSVILSGGGEEVDRAFTGVLWEYSELGRYDRDYRYELVLRPPTHFLTLNKRNRIFQNESAGEIVKSILGGDCRAKLNGSYDPLEYCVQYQESDFAFISRLMEYEGIYYYYEHVGQDVTMVLVDDANTHGNLTPAKVRVSTVANARDEAPVMSLVARRQLAPTKVTVGDYDFEAPKTSLEATQQAAERSNGTADAEMYDFPAKYTASRSSRGAHYGTVWLEAHRRRTARSFAEGRLFAAATGHRVKLTGAEGEAEYLIVGTRHHFDQTAYVSGSHRDAIACTMELMPAAMQYRPALVTPRPRIMGPQTAIVVGPAGEEIHTDKHGRIKVQFFWDREGKNDDTAGCFIRVMQSGAGQGWGSFALPRIGQEVVVSFLDGDPDRPLVTGAVYNATNTPPEALPDNKTQFGLKTRITKGGGGFNRLWFEDKKGSEVVWFRAERDYKVNIVNQDEERVYDKGSRTTTFKEGDTTLTVTKGKRTATIEGDDTATIRTGNVATTIEQGDETRTIKLGKRTSEVFGNEALTVKTGNMTVKVSAGSYTLEALQEITLKCGTSSIKLTPTAIEIVALNVKVQGQIGVDVKGTAMCNISAAGQTTVKGAIVMIN